MSPQFSNCILPVLAETVERLHTEQEALFHALLLAARKILSYPCLGCVETLGLASTSIKRLPVIGTSHFSFVACSSCLFFLQYLEHACLPRHTYLYPTK